MSDSFISEIFIFAGNFAPRGSSFCQGQILPVASNTTLFSLIGVTYGGNGNTTFELPHLAGRTPVGDGRAGGLSDYSLGQRGGVESVTLNRNELPPHTHDVTVNVGDGPPDTNDPNTHFLSDQQAGTYFSSIGDGTTFTWGQSTGVGGNMSHMNMQPYLAVNYCIAMQGQYPSRN